ncbi:Hypothetical protein EHI5A_201680 [Entamoeba histolytica KU27]|nr:Hypothetical protein EHI5A_201680 [Entamoeba histolytica KU27]
MPIIILIIVVFVALIIAIPDIKTSKEKYFYSFIGLLGLSYLVIGSLVLFVLLFFKIMYDLITQIIKIRNEQINTKSQWMLLFELVSPCLSKLVKKFWLWCKPYEKDHKWISWGLRIIHWVTIALSFVVLILFIVSLGFMTKDAKNMIGYWILFVVSSVFIGLIYVIKELRECIENAEKKHTSNNTSVNDTNTPTNKRTDNDTSSKTKQKKSKKKIDGLFGFDFEYSTLLLIILIFIVCLSLPIVKIIRVICKEKSPDTETPSIINESSQKYYYFANEMDYSYNDFDYANSYITKSSQSPLTDIVRTHSHLCSVDSYGITPIEYAYFCIMAKSNVTNLEGCETNSQDPSSSKPSCCSKSKNKLSESEKKLEEQRLVKCNLEKKGWKIKICEKNELHYVITNKKINEIPIKVITFRGSQSFSDFVYDIQLFSESIFPSLSTPFFPFFTKKTLIKISKFLSYFGTKALPGSDQFLLGFAKEVVMEELKDKNNPNVVLAGHSLGGGMANILGGELGLMSFGISPPGTYLASKNFGTKKKDIPVVARAIVPEKDPIAALGEDGGLQMSIPCDKHLFSCHSIKTSLCMIGKLCSDNETKDICSEN